MSSQYLVAAKIAVRKTTS